MQFDIRSSDQRTAAAAIVFLLAFLPLVIIVPTFFPHADGVVSAAQFEGYNNRVAHLLTVAWVAATGIVVFFLARSDNNSPVHQNPHIPINPRVIMDVSQLAGVGLVVLAIYFPPALARYGPYLEESIHLSALHRMLAGDVPYRDFEFLYGPSMLFVSYLWTRITDFSFTAFYTYVAILEAIVFVAILFLVQKHIEKIWSRLAAFLLLASLFFNPLVGPNQNGLRKVAGIALLFSVAHYPWSRKHWFAHGIGVGALLSYSQDFGAATALGIAGIYGTLFLKTRDRRAIVGLATIGVTAAVIWLAITWAILGDATFDYFDSLAYLTARFDAGEAAFRFYWTASSLAVFGLLFLAVWHVAKSVSRPWTSSICAGDLLFVGGIVYALVMLKSGLSRADQWHLVPSVLVLVFAFVLPVRAGVAPLVPQARKIGIFLSLILAVSYTFGQYPHANYVFRQGLIPGLRDIINQVPTGGANIIATARPALNDERSHPNPKLRGLSAFLAEPSQHDRRIFLYGSTWAIPYLVGATKIGNLGDDYIYGDDKGAAIRTTLTEFPDTLVIMSRKDYDWRQLGPTADPRERKFYMLGRGVWRSLRGTISSVHVRGVAIEEKLKSERWRRLAGQFIMENYYPIYTENRVVVLKKNLE